MLNEVQIAALELVAKLAAEDEEQSAESLHATITARVVGEWCRGRIEENAREVAPILDRDEQAMVATWNEVLP